MVKRKLSRVSLPGAGSSTICRSSVHHPGDGFRGCSALRPNDQAYLPPGVDDHRQSDQMMIEPTNARRSAAANCSAGSLPPCCRHRPAINERLYPPTEPTHRHATPLHIEPTQHYMTHLNDSTGNHTHPRGDDPQQPPWASEAERPGSPAARGRRPPTEQPGDDKTTKCQAVRCSKLFGRKPASLLTPLARDQ